MRPRIDINADLGESFGRWRLGDDAALMPHVSSASIACGYHGGDPHVMRTCVRLAAEHGIAIGAHVGFPDLVGFGRRELRMTPEELQDCVTYQVGALMGFAAAAGLRVEHVKAHSAMYRMCILEAEYAAAFAEAVHAIDRELIVITVGETMTKAAKVCGLRCASEAFIDLEYDEQGYYVAEWPKRRWDPEVVATRAIAVAIDGAMSRRDGTTMRVEAQSVCIHGETDQAPEIARIVRRRLVERGIDVMPLRHLV